MKYLLQHRGRSYSKSFGGPLNAMKCLIAVYYTLNFCYLKACSNTYIFIQKHVLQILDSNHTPVKVTGLVNESGFYLSVKTEYPNLLWFYITMLCDWFNKKTHTIFSTNQN